MMCGFSDTFYVPKTVQSLGGGFARTGFAVSDAFTPVKTGGVIKEHNEAPILQFHSSEPLHQELQ